MSPNKFENITLEAKDGKAFLTINRPPLNILNIATMKEINTALSSLAGNNDVKVLVITGAGEKAFSAGVDIEEHTKDKVEEIKAKKQASRSLTGVLSAVYEKKSQDFS